MFGLVAVVRSKFRLVAIYTVIATLAATVGCAKNSAIRPTAENTTTNGLVMLRVELKNSENIQVSIDGDRMIPNSDNQQLVLVLPPGRHKLESIVTVGYTSSTTYPVNREFDVKAGTATSLGVASFILGKGDMFRILWVADAADAQEYLNGGFPEIARGRKVSMAGGSYLTPQELEKLRNYLALQEVATLQSARVPQPQSGYVTSAVGTLASYQMGGGRTPVVKLVDTGTVHPIGKCAEMKSGIACPMANGRKILVYSGNKVTSYPLPAGSKASYLFSRGGDSLLARDESFTLSFSNDGGRTWRSDTRFRIEETVRWQKETRGKNGIYIYSTDDDGTLLYLPDKHDVATKIDTGPAADKFAVLVETPDGIFLGPEYTLFGSSRVFFKANGSKEWAEYEVPETGCHDLFLDKQGQLVVKCDSEYLVSSDKGKHWVKTK